MHEKVPNEFLNMYKDYYKYVIYRPIVEIVIGFSNHCAFSGQSSCPAILYEIFLHKYIQFPHALCRTVLRNNSYD